MKINNKIILYLILGLMLISFSYALPDGSGTEGSPYLVSDCEELHSLGDATLYGNYYYAELDGDIDCSSFGDFKAIGISVLNADNILNFNGNNYKIENVVVNCSSTGADSCGLFTYVTGNSTLESVIENIYFNNIEVINPTDIFVGLIVGDMSITTMRNIKIENSIMVSDKEYSGGVVGYMTNSNIYNLTFENSIVEGVRYLGGVVGSSVSSCEFDGILLKNVSVDSTMVRKGYLIGQGSSQTVNNVIAITNYQVYANRATAMDGDGSLNFVNGFSDSNTTGNSHTYSRTTEELKTSSTYNSSWDFVDMWGEIEGDYPYLKYDITVRGDGSAENPFQITNCNEFIGIEINYSYIQMNDFDWSDCIGNTVRGNLLGGYYDGQNYDITGYISNNKALFNDIDYSTIKNLNIIEPNHTSNTAVDYFSFFNVGNYASNYVTFNNVHIVRPIINARTNYNRPYACFLSYGGSSYSITKFYNSSCEDVDVYMYGNSGRFAGIIFDVSANTNSVIIEGCFTSGNVEMQQDIGLSSHGLFGNVRNYGGYVKNSYSTINFDTPYTLDSISACKSIGRTTNQGNKQYVYGASTGVSIQQPMHYGGFVSDSFFDGDLANVDCQTETADGDCLTTSEMKNVNNYINAGWDFVNVWGLNDYNAYPCLLWEEGCVDYANFLEMVDLQISNESNFINKDKVYYDIYEPVYYALNYTDGVNPILNGSCWFSFYEPVEIDTATENDFTLCNTCDYDSYDYDFSLENIIYINTDYIELNVCHISATNRDIDISYTCGGNTYYETLSASQIPSCSGEEIVNQIEISECVSYEDVNIEIDNTAINEVQGHNINSLRLLREIINKTVDTTNSVIYDEGLKMYVLDHEHYYNTMGSKLVEGGCNVQEVEQTIIIENLIPIINLDTLFNDCDSITETGEIQYCNDDWVFVTPIVDDNLVSVFYNISCENGEITDTLSYSEWLESGLVIDGNNFKNFESENICSFYMLVTDSYSQTAYVSSSFTVIDDVAPVCIGVEDENLGVVGSVGLDITCTDERLDTYFISCYNPYNSEILLEFNESSIVNESYTYQDFIFVYDMVVCSIIATDEGNGSIQYAKILRYDSTFSESGVSSVVTQRYNSSLQAGKCADNDGSLAMLGFVLVIAGFLFVMALVWSSRVLGFVSALFLFVFAWNVGACSSIFGILVTGLGVIVIAMSVFGIETKEKGFY